MLFQIGVMLSLLVVSMSLPSGLKTPLSIGFVFLFRVWMVVAVVVFQMRAVPSWWFVIIKLPLGEKRAL